MYLAVLYTLSKMGKILDRLNANKILVSDGAWGTFLHAKGLKVDECPESWNLSRPDDVLDIARSYIEAGADLVETNSFGANPYKLEAYGLQDKVYELNRAAAEISRKAAGEEHLVIGSVGPTGKMVLMGEVPPQEVFQGFMDQVRGLAEGGSDGIVIETMSDLEEARLALEAADKVREELAGGAGSEEHTGINTGGLLRAGLDLICTFTFEKNQDGVYRTMMGTEIADYLAMCREAGADIVGANCGNGTAGMIEITREIRRLDPEIPILVHANAGLPRYEDGKTVFPEGPDEMAAQISGLVEAGACLVGGCCGTTPEHIRQIASAVRA